MAVNCFSFNRRIQFGYTAEITNENTGAPTKSFVKEFERWGKIRSRNLKEEVAIEGTSLANTISVVVRYSPKINDQLNVKIGNEIYQIISVSFPNNLLFSDHIFLSVKLIDKVGKH